MKWKLPGGIDNRSKRNNREKQQAGIFLRDGRRGKNDDAKKMIIQISSIVSRSLRGEYYIVCVMMKLPYKYYNYSTLRVMHTQRRRCNVAENARRSRTRRVNIHDGPCSE